MKEMKLKLASVLSLSIALGITGCSNASKSLVDGNKLGAADYKPAVYVKPGNESQYDGVLQVCRRVAVNRQFTAADEAQLNAITGSIQGAVDGATTGLAVGAMLKNSGYDASRGESAAIGAAAGILGAVTSSFTSGTDRTARETKRVLLACLRETSEGGSKWKVLE